MSRTVKGGKGCGYEYWSSRPYNKSGSQPGKYTKKRTHKAERQEGKRKANEQE